MLKTAKPANTDVAALTMQMMSEFLKTSYLHKTVQVVTIVILFQEKNQEENKFEIKLDTKNCGLLKRVHASKKMGTICQDLQNISSLKQQQMDFYKPLKLQKKSVAISFFFIQQSSEYFFHWMTQWLEWGLSCIIFLQKRDRIGSVHKGSKLRLPLFTFKRV